MKKMFYTLILLTIVFISKGQKLHAYFVCKTNDPKIGKSAKMNFVNVSSMCEIIADSLGYKYEGHSIIGVDYTMAKFDKEIANSVIDGKDIVIIYLNSHGAKSVWDKSIFPQVDIPNIMLASYDMFNKIKNRHPKILITLVEACSGYKDITPQESFLNEEFSYSEQGETVNAPLKSNLQSLFDSTCSLMICSGQPGMNTWATNQGSIFTNCFIKAFNEVIYSSDFREVNWHNILNKSKNYTSEVTKLTKLHHYPVWEMNNCSSSIAQTTIDTANARTDAKFLIRTVKNTQIPVFDRQFYDITFTIQSNRTIDSVTYFSHYTLDNAKITMKNKVDNFKLSTIISDEFTVKAKVYYSDGKLEDIYERIKFETNN